MSGWSRVVLVLFFAGLSACSPGAPEGGRLVGTLERDRLELVAEAQEPIVEIAVVEGDVVASGDLLVRLEGGRLAAEAERAAAERDRARARLAEVERGPRAERIRNARAELAAAESDVRTAQLDVERQRALVASAVAPQQSLDHALNVVDAAAARRDRGRATLDELENGSTREELDQAREAVDAAVAALAEVEVRLARLEVRAPVDGTVDALPYEVGERPAPGAVVAVMLASGRPYVRVYVPEEARARVGPGTVAAIRADGVTEPLRGRVRWVQSEAAFTPFFALTEHDRGYLSYLAEVELTDERALGLPSGLPVEVELDLAAAGDGGAPDGG